MTTKNQIPKILIAAIILIALIFTWVWLSGMLIPASPLPNENTSINTTSEADKNDVNLKGFPPEIHDEVQSLSEKYSISLKYWGFDPIHNEIALIAYGIHDTNATKDLQGKKVGSYTIHIFNESDFRTTESEIRAYINELERKPEYQISSMEMVYSHNGPRVELWCVDLTPENQKLENVVIFGWRFYVNVCCAVPNSTIAPTSNLASEEQINSELLEQLRTFSMHQDFGINTWEFGPDTNQITLFVNDIRNDSQIEILQGTHIGNYTIRIIHDTEFEKIRNDVLTNLTQLQKDSRYHINTINMGTAPFSSPPGYFTEVWVDELTPENKKLDNSMIQGWRIKILKPSFDPENYKPLTISTISGTSPASTSS